MTLPAPPLGAPGAADLRLTTRSSDLHRNFPLLEAQTQELPQDEAGLPRESAPFPRQPIGVSLPDPVPAPQLNPHWSGSAYSEQHLKPRPPRVVCIKPVVLRIRKHFRGWGRRCLVWLSLEVALPAHLGESCFGL